MSLYVGGGWDRQFAATVGVTFATVNRWEAGKAKPSRLAMNRREELRKGLTEEN